MALEATNVYDFFQGQEMVEFDCLSRVYAEFSTSASHQLRNRNCSELRRPILIDGLDLMKGVNGRVNDRLLTLPLMKSLFYFIARGHRTVACIPKHYWSISDDPEALNTLVQLGLIDWVPCGHNYTYSRPTMDRYLVTNSKKTSGCIVSKSQMSDLCQLWPHLADIVEKRLLMPSWVSGEMMLPPDGPQGRFGVSLEETLKTTVDDVLCAQYQLTGLQQLRFLRAFAHPQLLGNFIDGRKSAALAEELKRMLPEADESEAENRSDRHENVTTQKHVAALVEEVDRQRMEKEKAAELQDERACRQRQMETVNLITPIPGGSALVSAPVVEARPFDARPLTFVDWTKYAPQPSTSSSTPPSSMARQKLSEPRSLGADPSSSTLRQQQQEEQCERGDCQPKTSQSLPKRRATVHYANFGARSFTEEPASSAQEIPYDFFLRRPKYAFYEKLCEVVGINKADKVIIDHPDIVDLEELVMLALNYD